MRCNRLRFVFAVATTVAATGCAAEGSRRAGQAGNSSGATPARMAAASPSSQTPSVAQSQAADVLALVRSEAAMIELASCMRAELEGRLAATEPDNRAELLKIYQQLALCDLIARRYEEALARIEKGRALEEKPGRRLTVGLFAESMIAARRQVPGGPAAPEYHEVFRRELASRLRGLPWSLVGDEVRQAAAELEALSQDAILDALRAQVQPALDRGEQLSRDQSIALLQAHFQLRERLPLKDKILTVLHETIEKHRELEPDIWPGRSVRLSADEPLNYVVMAVWDTGVDVDVLGPVLQVNPMDWVDGLDNDDNGYVDDFYGIAYDADARPVPELLPPLGEVSGRLGSLLGFLEGFSDLEAGLQSPRAAALRQHLDALSADQLPRFVEELGLVADYVHGTHVAGILIDGNPWARLVIARLTYDHRAVPVARTPEWAQREAAKYLDTVEYLRQRRARIVNMSWSESLRDVEKSLEANGIGETAEQRRELARRVFSTQHDALYKAIRDARDVLFVCAADNRPDGPESELIPASFELPNLLVVGAVGRSGAPIAFTSLAPTVQVYANGVEVESLIPGGKRLKLSGSSVAAAAAANLAGKLLSIDPSLKPPEVIQLIRDGAEPHSVGSRQILLLNPRQTVELARKRHAGRSGG